MFIIEKASLYLVHMHSAVGKKNHVFKIKKKMVNLREMINVDLMLLTEATLNHWRVPQVAAEKH